MGSHRGIHKAGEQTVYDNGKKNRAFLKDALDLIQETRADVMYLDPPYKTTRTISYQTMYKPMTIIAE